MGVQFRNIRQPAEPLIVLYGVPAPTRVGAGDTVTVADEAAPAYACQPAIWEQVDGASAVSATKAKAPKAPAATDAANPGASPPDAQEA